MEKLSISVPSEQHLSVLTPDGFQVYAVRGEGIMSDDSEKKKSDSTVDETLELEEIPTFHREGIEFFEYSPDGRYIALVDSKRTKVELIDAQHSGETVHVIQEPSVELIQFSPKGTFMAIWKRAMDPEVDAPKGNLYVYDLRSPLLEKVGTFWHGGYSRNLWPYLHWDAEENFLYRIATNEIQGFRGGDAREKPTVRHREVNVSKFSISPNGRWTVLFIPGKKGIPSHVKMCQVLPSGDIAHEACRKSLFHVDSMHFFWSASGDRVLVLTHSDHDPSKKSYYGSTKLFLLDGVKNEIKDVPPIGDGGMVHSCQWAPKREEFIVVQGSMPASAACFGQNGEPFFDFGTGYRNLVSWCPTGRMIILGGFRNLPGNMEYWFRDSKKFKHVNALVGKDPVTYQWSSCGGFFLTVTTSPQLVVDNGFHIYKYNGLPVFHRSLTKLFRARWRPALHGAIPPHFPSPRGKVQARDLMAAKIDQDTGMRSEKKPSTILIASLVV
jgi:translation initiation factor 2A